MDTTLPPDFKEFLKLLNAHSVEYLLIGGYAVGYHGYPRATKDIDIWIAFHPDNASRIVAALRDFGFDVPESTSDLFLKDRSIVRMGMPPTHTVSSPLGAVCLTRLPSCKKHGFSELADSDPPIP